jgi:hypothetical protein
MGHPIRSSKDFAPPFPTILQGEQMKFHFGCKPFLAAILGLVLATTACSSQWISVALADLPVLTQMALNIGTLVTTMDSGSPITPAETAGIQAISNEASKDLNLLQSLTTTTKPIRMRPRYRKLTTPLRASIRIFPRFCKPRTLAIPLCWRESARESI